MERSGAVVRDAVERERRTRRGAGEERAPYGNDGGVKGGVAFRVQRGACVMQGGQPAASGC